MWPPGSVQVCGVGQVPSSIPPRPLLHGYQKTSQEEGTSPEQREGPWLWSGAQKGSAHILAGANCLKINPILKRSKPNRNLTKMIKSPGDACHMLSLSLTHTPLPMCTMHTLAYVFSHGLCTHGWTYTAAYTHAYVHTRMSAGTPHAHTAISHPTEHQWLVPGAQCRLLTWRV